MKVGAAYFFESRLTSVFADRIYRFPAKSMGGYNTVTVLEDSAPLGSDSSAEARTRTLLRTLQNNLKNHPIPLNSPVLDRICERFR